MSLESWISIGGMVIVSTLAFIFSYRKHPVIGTCMAGLIVLGSLFFQKQGLDTIGFTTPRDWPVTAAWGLGLGIGLYFLSLLVIEPVVENSTVPAHVPRAAEKEPRSWKRLLLLLASTWLLAAFLEEAIFRGFLITGIEKIITGQRVFASIALLLSAIAYGLAHWHKGISGALTATILGLILGDIFIWSGYNLWVPILTRGVMETLGLLLAFFKLDTQIRRSVWKEKTNERRKRSTQKNI